MDEYLEELAARIEAVLGPDLVGVYAGGSYALDAFEPGRSDLDVSAVARDRMADERKRELVARVRHEALPCPARRLELVVYRLDAVRVAHVDAPFELNLNTGADSAQRVDLAPGSVEAHWFPIDRAVLAAAGVALRGPPAAEVFAALPRDRLLPVLASALRWYLDNLPWAPDAVLNACRARLFAAEGLWASKNQAGTWALERGAPPIVADALRARREGRDLDPDAARAFVEPIASELVDEAAR